MGNSNTKESESGMTVPTPSGRSVPKEESEKADFVIDNIPDKTADENDPQSRIITMIKMQEYYTEEERSHFWGRGDEDEQGNPDEEKKDDGEIRMATKADINNLYENSRKTEDYFKENIRKLYPVAIKQSYKTELENINEIIAVIEYYKSDLESVLGKMQQDVDSPLFVSILSHRNAIFDYIVLNHPQYIKQQCCGLSVCGSAIMFDNHHVFMSVFRKEGELTDYSCVYTLLSMALDMFWSEEKLELWFGGIKENITWDHLLHLRNFVNQELQRLLVKYPQVMAEVKVMTNELHPDAQKHSQV